ncbi:MAG: metallophosphoesterase family protein [Rhizomicrobium sp.]
MPEGTRIYAIGDIHGCDDALKALQREITRDAAPYPGTKLIVYLGDYVDRGPNSREVIERLMHKVPAGFAARYVKGNHDAAVLDFLEDAEIYRLWRHVGAAETLASYGVRPPLFAGREKLEQARRAFSEAFPRSHLDFLKSLELMVLIGEYAFVHAGIRPGVALEQQRADDLLWIRNEFLEWNAPHPKIVVHGHSPVPVPLIRHNRICVDTSAYLTGILSCAVLEGDACRFLQAQGH